MTHTSLRRPSVNKWRAVVFDLDDTLYPESDYVLSGFRAVATWAAEHLGIPQEIGYESLEGLFRSACRGNTFDRWLALHHVAAGSTMIAELTGIYRDHQPTGLTAFPEVRDVLTQLKRNVSLGIVSDGYLAVQQRKLAALGLAPYFDTVVFSDQWGRGFWKPSQRPFLAVCEQLAVKAENAIYVGDNPHKDFHGARSLGMGTVRVQREEGEHAAAVPVSKLHAPDVTISSLRELPDLLGVERLPRRAL